MNVLSIEKNEILSRVGDLIEQSQGTDFVIPEDTGYFSIEDDLVKNIRSLVRQTADLMLEIMECYDAEVESSVPEDISAADDEAFLKEIGAQIASQTAVEEVSGLAFVSRGQLLDMVAAIDGAIAAERIWKVASQLDTGLRRAGRALIAIESAIRECEGLPVRYRQWQNLDDSLEVRRLYGEFRRAILSRCGGDPDQAPEGEELAASLGHAGEAIAKLRRLEIYPYLRIDDRLQIRRFQRRILAWLDSEGASEDEEGLWGDLVSFARLLAQVNLRQEIREHDRLAVNGIYRRFYRTGEEPRRLEPQSLALLEPLLGLDDELDSIILEPDRHAGDDLRRSLERLRQELGRPFERQTSDFLHPAHG